MKTFLIAAAVVVVLLILFILWRCRPLDYKKNKNWAMKDFSSEKEADCFLVYPTVDMGKTGNIFADVNNAKYRSKAIGTLKQMRGLYDEKCNIYAPFYRQSTFRTITSGENYETYLTASYIDVRKAFDSYLDSTDDGRPLILAGFSQGSAMALRLYAEFAKKPKIAKRIVAVYCIGWHYSDDDIKMFPHIKPAKGEDDTGVIVAYNSEAEDTTLAVEGYKTHAINPLNWKTDGTPADKSLNKGAKFFDTYGNVTEEIPEFCGAYIDEKSGCLKVVGVSKEKYLGKIFPDGIFHVYDYMFFFNNIKENVKTRISAYLAK